MKKFSTIFLTIVCSFLFAIVGVKASNDSVEFGENFDLFIDETVLENNPWFQDAINYAETNCSGQNYFIGSKLTFNNGSSDNHLELICMGDQNPKLRLLKEVNVRGIVSYHWDIDLYEYHNVYVFQGHEPWLKTGWNYSSSRNFYNGSTISSDSWEDYKNQAHKFFDVYTNSSFELDSRTGGTNVNSIYPGFGTVTIMAPLTWKNQVYEPGSKFLENGTLYEKETMNFRKEFNTDDVKSFSFNMFQTNQENIKLRIEYEPQNEVNILPFFISIWYSDLADDSDVYNFYECEECQNFLGAEKVDENVYEFYLYDFFNQIKQIHPFLNAVEVRFQAENVDDLKGVYKVYDDTDGKNTGWSKVNVWRDGYYKFCTKATDFLISSAHKTLSSGSIVIDNETLQNSGFKVFEFKYDQQSNFDQQIFPNIFDQDKNFSIFNINLNFENKQIIKVSTSSSEQKCFFLDPGFSITEISDDKEEKVEIDTPDGKVEIDVNSYDSVNSIIDYVNRFLKSIKSYVQVFFDLLNYFWTNLNDNIKGLIISIFVLLLVSAVIAIARK